LAQATADRLRAQARFDQSRNAGGVQTEALTNTAINELREKRAELSAEYQRLMVQFEPGYPAAKALASQIAQLDTSIAHEEGRIAASLAANYRQALDRETSLSTKVDKLKSDLLDLRRRSIQYTIYQREVDTNRQLYDGLLQRYKEIGVAGGVGVNNVSIVDPAETPRLPSSPRLLLNLLCGLVAGVALGILVVFVLEQSEESIADPVVRESEWYLSMAICALLRYTRCANGITQSIRDISQTALMSPVAPKSGIDHQGREVEGCLTSRIKSVNQSGGSIPIGILWCPNSNACVSQADTGVAARIAAHMGS